uniref:G_PROTEIN_RECEP_F1_2 domain-containing protein n=1 Tax=Elaeophora elaphi TaxID=1147741 RepID=A0A0R3RFS9_9BILA
MEEMDNSSSASTSPRSILSYHRGNGTLRGGGIQKVYHTGPTFKVYKRKLDYRLGYCTVGCLITIAVVLTIFGLFHETAHQELIQYIESTRQMIINSIPTTVSPGDTASTIPAADLLEITSSSDEEEILFDSDDDWLNENFFDNETAMPMEMMVGIANLGDHKDELRHSGALDEKRMLSGPYNEPDTCYGSEDVDREKCLVATELDEYHNILFKSHIALWNLATVNLIVAIFLSPFTFMFNSEMIKNEYYKLFYRVVLFLVLFFMAAQLIVLINPLLCSSFMYPTIVDKLFVEKLPRSIPSIEKGLTNRVEFRFACQFDYISQLVELNLQEPCIPRIKNVLLLPYAVVLLIIIDLLPFMFIFFTYAWDKWLKDSPLCSIARSRIELNNQRR